MKQRITPEQVSELAPQERNALSDWWQGTLEYDDDLVSVYIPEEQAGENEGRFKGYWDRECRFIYPEEYYGKLKNHRGTILPLLSIGEMVAFLNDHMEKHDGWWSLNKSRYPDVWTLESKYDVGLGYEDRPELVDCLWEAVKAVVRQEQDR